MKSAQLAEVIFGIVIHGTGTKRELINRIAEEIDMHHEPRPVSAEDVETVRDTLVLVGEIREKIEAVERCEVWTDGEPTLGTCRTFGRIKEITDSTRNALAALDRIAGKEE